MKVNSIKKNLMSGKTGNGEMVQQRDGFNYEWYRKPRESTPVYPPRQKMQAEWDYAADAEFGTVPPPPAERFRVAYLSV